jgi:flagellar protein FliT
VNASIAAWEKTMRTYESLAEKSTAMLEAARRREWDTVIEIERECEALLAGLKANGDLIPLDESARRRKVQLIRSLLVQDAEIRDLAQPWMAELSQALHLTRVQRKVENAYG